MNIQEFESQYRVNIDQTLNELQTAILLLARVQNTVSQIGSSVQILSQTVEEFINEQNQTNNG